MRNIIIAASLLSTCLSDGLSVLRHFALSVLAAVHEGAEKRSAVPVLEDAHPVHLAVEHGALVAAPILVDHLAAFSMQLSVAVMDGHIVHGGVVYQCGDSAPAAGAACGAGKTVRLA